MPKGAWSETVGPWTTAGVGTHTQRVTKPVTQELTILMTDEEKARLAEDLADLADREARLDQRKKSFVARWKARKERVAAERGNKLSAVRTGKEKRLVSATQVYDHESRTTYFVTAESTERYLERAMKDAEFLIGQPPLFVEKPEESNVTEIRPAIGNGIDAELVASSEDGKVTKLSDRKRRQPPRAGMVSVDSDVRDVMRSEKSARTKKDHTT